MTTPVRLQLSCRKESDRPVQPIRLYEVTVRHGDDEHTRPVSARSASAARYQAFVEAETGMSFRDYQRVSRVRVRRTPLGPEEDGYDYVRWAYGISPRVGQRVTIAGEGGSLEGRGGTVACAYTSRHYVHVVLDGETTAGLFHPRSVVLSAAPAATLPDLAARPACDEVRPPQPAAGTRRAP